jgi:hypothetical protein
VNFCGFSEEIPLPVEIGANFPNINSHIAPLCR